MKKCSTIQQYVLLLLIAACLLIAGCKTYVKSADVTNVPEGAAAPSGIPQTSLDYINAKYPDSTWHAASNTARVAVGPIVVSRRAALAMYGDDFESIKARATSGTSTAYVSVQRNSVDQFFYVSQTSREVQSIIVEKMLAASNFRVFTVDAGQQGLLLNNPPYRQMDKDGVRYYIDGDIVKAEDGGSSTVHLRFTDTATREIVCANSGEGSDLPAATEKAVELLVKSVSPSK